MSERTEMPAQDSVDHLKSEFDGTTLRSPVGRRIRRFAMISASALGIAAAVGAGFLFSGVPGSTTDIQPATGQVGEGLTTPVQAESPGDPLVDSGPVPQPADPKFAEALQRDLIGLLEAKKALPSLLGPFRAVGLEASTFPGGGGSNSVSVGAEESRVLVSLIYGSTARAIAPESVLTGSKPLDPATLPDGVAGAGRETRRIGSGEILSSHVTLISTDSPGFTLTVGTVGGGVPIEDLVDLARGIYALHPSLPPR